MEMIDHSSIVGIGKREGTTGMGIVFAPSLASDAASGEVIYSFFYSLITEIVIAAEGYTLSLHDALPISAIFRVLKSISISAL